MQNSISMQAREVKATSLHAVPGDKAPERGPGLRPLGPAGPSLREAAGPSPGLPDARGHWQRWPLPMSRVKASQTSTALAARSRAAAPHGRSRYRALTLLRGRLRRAPSCGGRPGAPAPPEGRGCRGPAGRGVLERRAGASPPTVQKATAGARTPGRAPAALRGGSQRSGRGPFSPPAPPLRQAGGEGARHPADTELAAAVPRLLL